MQPRSLAPALQQQMMTARKMWQADRQAQRAGVQVPDALEVKYPRLGANLGLVLVVPLAYFVS